MLLTLASSLGNAGACSCYGRTRSQDSWASHQCYASRPEKSHCLPHTTLSSTALTQPAVETTREQPATTITPSMRRNTVPLLMLHAARALRCAPLRTRRTLALRRAQPRIYDAPTLYDAAFGFRDFEDEVDFLCAAHEKHGNTGGAPVKILELAAGPARHAVEAASRGMEAKAVDLSEAMVKCGTQIAKEEDVALDYRVGDVREPLPFTDVCSAWLLLGSVGHLLTNDDALRCFQRAKDALKTGGTLILELPHPRETFRVDGVSRGRLGGALRGRRPARALGC